MLMIASRCVGSNHRDEEDLEEYFRKKYADSASTQDMYGDGVEMADEISQQGLLPGVKYVRGCLSSYVFRCSDNNLLYKWQCLHKCCFCRTRRDPNLWVVRCRIGEEQATAIALMRKFIAYQFTDDVSMNCVLLSVCTE